MKQFVIRYENVRLDKKTLKSLIIFNQYPLTRPSEFYLRRSDPEAVFDFLYNNYKGSKSPESFAFKTPLTQSRDHDIVCSRFGLGVLMVKHDDKQNTLDVYYNFDETNPQSNLFNKHSYPLLSAYSNIPDDIRKGELLYTNDEQWAINTYLENLLNKKDGEAKTLAAFRDLSLHELSYLTSEHPRYKELREAILYWLSNSTTGVFRDFIESTIKTQQLIIDTKP